MLGICRCNSFTKNDSCNDILKFGTPYVEFPLYILLSISIKKVSWCTVNLEGMYLVSYCDLGAGSCTKTHRLKLLYIVGCESQPG